MISPGVDSNRFRRRPSVLAQAMVPPTGMDDANKPMPMAERMNRRFPQPVRVGDLIGLPVLDDTFFDAWLRPPGRAHAAGKIELIVSYSRWFGWFGRPVAVPIEVVGIEGRQLASLDMPRSEYATAPDLAGHKTRRRCPTTRRSESRWPAIERSRLCEADNFLVSRDLYRVRRK